MEPEARPPAVRVSDADRERAAEVLQRACGEGRLTLEEFTLRVGTVWAATTSGELVQATSDLAPPPVGSGQPAEKIVTVFSETKRAGRWRLSRALRITTVFGSTKLDLRDAALGSDTMSAQAMTIRGRCVFGEVKVIVPEGVEVELTGACVFSSRTLDLAPVSRLPGAPLIEVHVNTYFGNVTVCSERPEVRRPFRT